MQLKRSDLLWMTFVMAAFLMLMAQFSVINAKKNEIENKQIAKTLYETNKSMQRAETVVENSEFTK
mgnify:CR=1 FL=1